MNGFPAGGLYVVEERFPASCRRCAPITSDCVGCSRSARSRPAPQIPIRQLSPVRRLRLSTCDQHPKTRSASMQTCVGAAQMCPQGSEQAWRSAVRVSSDGRHRGRHPASIPPAPQRTTGDMAAPRRVITSTPQRLPARPSCLCGDGTFGRGGCRAPRSTIAS